MTNMGKNHIFSLYKKNVIFPNFGIPIESYKVIIIEYYYRIHNLCCKIFPTLYGLHHLDVNRVRYGLVKVAS